jgi:hypothetical protein
MEIGGLLFFGPFGMAAPTKESAESIKDVADLIKSLASQTQYSGRLIN